MEKDKDEFEITAEMIEACDREGLLADYGSCRFRRKPATYSDLIAATLPI